MNLVKTNISILLALVFYSACQTNSTENRKLDQVDSVTVKNEKDLEEPDSIETVLESKLKDAGETKNADIKEKEGTQILEIIDRKNDDVWLGDPFEDPDYIGTPCGDYVNGICTRHHHKNEFLEKPEYYLDSL